VNIWQIRCAAYLNLLRHPLSFTPKTMFATPLLVLYDRYMSGSRDIVDWFTGNARLAAGGLIY
jgi:hypothetical protein